MFNVTSVKVSELAHILERPNSFITKDLKNSFVKEGSLNKTAMNALPPEIVEAYLTKEGYGYLYDNFVTLIGTNVGGVGKTSTTVNLAAVTRRITGRNKAVVILDCDSQGSATTQVLGEVIDDGQPVLDDYFSGKASLTDILTPVGDPKDNIWIVGSNLNNVYLDRRFTNARQIRTLMKELLDAIFDHFGEGTKIFIDTPPQLSAVTQSATCALALSEVKSVFLIPMRADLFSIKGAKICLGELEDLTLSYKDVDKVNVQCFLSSYDGRLKVSTDTMQTLLEDTQLNGHICNVIVRHSSEVTKTAMKRENVYSSGTLSHVTYDFLDLALTIYGRKVEQ